MKNAVILLNANILKDRSAYDYYYEKMRPERRERIDRMRFEKGKRLRLGAGIVMEYALQYAGCADREITLTQSGKPMVEGCHFNLSDTEEVAVCAVSDCCVGIDIEKPRDMGESLIQKAFTPDEIRGAAKDPLYFTRLWTIKESVMKWYGLGLGLMPERIDVRMGDAIRVSIADAQELETPPDKLRFTTYQMEEYRITVCSVYDEFTDEITVIDDAIKNKLF